MRPPGWPGTGRQAGKVTAVAALLAALPLSGYVVGRNVDRASSGSQVVPSVWVAVGTDPVERAVSFSAEVVPAPASAVVARGPGTITAIAVAPGDNVAIGDRLFDLDGFAVFASDPDTFLPYRDLAEGDAGPDVAGLQRLLTATGHYGHEASGTFDAATSAAVEALYIEVSGRSRTTFAQSSIALVDPAKPVQSVDIAPGDVVDTGTEIATLAGGPPNVVAETTGATANQLSVSDVIRLDAASGDKSLAATIVAIDDPQLTEEGRTVQVITMRPDSPDDVRGGDRFKATFVVESSQPGDVSVPVLAVRTDPSGESFVIVRKPDGGGASGARVRLGVSDGTMVVVYGDGVDAGGVVQVFADRRD